MNEQFLITVYWKKELNPFFCLIFKAGSTTYHSKAKIQAFTTVIMVVLNIKTRECYSESLLPSQGLYPAPPALSV